MIAPDPVTLAQLPDDWIAERREIVVREGYALRAGAGNTIAVQSINTGEWLPLGLPGGAVQFTTTADRDTVLAQLQGVATP